MMIYGEDPVKLASKYKTPFYFSSEDTLINNIRIFKKVFSSLKNFKIYYSVKTNFESEFLRTIRRCGCGAEIAGDLDFYCTSRAGFNLQDIIFDGPVKDPDFLKFVIKKGINCINVESIDEARLIDNISRRLNEKPKIGLRIDTLVDKLIYDNVLDTYKRKFGIPVSKTEEAIKVIADLKNVDFRCLHSHIGSQIYNPNLFTKSLEKIFKIMNNTKDLVSIDEINTGGGFPTKSIKTTRIPKSLKLSKTFEKIGLTKEYGAPPIGVYARAIIDSYKGLSDQYDLEPSIVTEPGRSLVADTTVLIGKVVIIKKPWVFVDISINDIAEQTFFMIRETKIANKENLPAVEEVNITGPTLATNDVIKLRENLPSLEVGDTVVVNGVGAYSISRATQFTRPRSAFYFKTKSGKIKLIRKAENPEDVTRCQIW